MEVVFLRISIIAISVAMLAIMHNQYIILRRNKLLKEECAEFFYYEMARYQVHSELEKYNFYVTEANLVVASTKTEDEVDKNVFKYIFNSYTADVRLIDRFAKEMRTNKVDCSTAILTELLRKYILEGYLDTAFFIEL